MSRPRTLAVYLGTVGVPVLVAVVLILAVARGDTGHPGRPVPASTVVDHVLLAIVVVVVLAALAGALAARLRQPRVVGQMVLGVLLGPSLFGAALPSWQRWLLPAEATSAFTVLAQFGVMLFMFLVGRELAAIEVGQRATGVVALGHAMVAVPFALGTALAVALPASLRPAGTSRLAFVLFVALATSVTALPVLAHILTERGMLRGRLGWLGIGAAAVGDVTAWCVLALTLALAGRSSVRGAAVTVLAGLAFFAVMWWLVRPWLRRWADRTPRSAVAANTVLPALVLAAVILAGLATDQLGLHSIFGAFLVGVISPRSPALAAAAARIEGVTDWLLLPMFFVSIGLQTRLGLLDSVASLLLCAAVVVVAVLGKWLGAAGTARLLRMDRWDSLSLGAMMNCRGLTELVVLNIGLTAHIIGPQLFAAFVVMTVLTTALTGPSLDFVHSRRSRARPAEVPVPMAAVT